MIKQNSVRKETSKFLYPFFLLSIIFALTSCSLFLNADAVENNPPNETHPHVQIPSAQSNSYTIRYPQYDNLSYGIPGEADTIIEREGYALGYIEKHEQPAWVIYVLTAEEVSTRIAKRGNNFRE